MQFAYQFPGRCERLVLVGSGGLGRDVSPLLRALAFPGIEYLYPVLFASFWRDAGRAALSAVGRIGLRPSAHAEQIWRSYEALTDPPARAAFVRTLRSVIDLSGQHVSAHDRLSLAAHIPTLVVWGDADAIIPSRHAHAAQDTLPASRLEIFEGVGHFPHCEDPDRFAKTLSKFIDETDPASMTEEHLARAMRQASTS
jgi:pimeloyl-ACP methyl ester carboxylesterase